MRLKGFDGLRGISIIGVFITHKTVWGDYTQYGRTGLWMFFFLCGFLVALQLSSARGRVASGISTARSEIVNFLYKRALRIFPAYYMIIIVMAIVWTLQGREVPGLIYHLTFLSNFYFEYHAFAVGADRATEYLSSLASTWLHYWSLSAEYQFYLVIAPLFMLAAATTVGILCMMALVIGLLVRFVFIAIHAPDVVILIDTLTNTALFGAGACIYIYREKIGKYLRAFHLNNGASSALLILLFFPSVAFCRVVFEGQYALDQFAQIVALAIGAILLAQVFLNQENAVIRLLENRSLVYLGQISYGFYLYNSYVPASLPSIFFEKIMNTNSVKNLIPVDLYKWAEMICSNVYFGLAVCFIVSFLVSHWSWIYIQKPILDKAGSALTARPAKTSGPVARR